MVNRATTPPSSRGFTLIELLVVMAIIALLAGMIVALVGVTGDKKAISSTRAEIERLSTLIQVYKLKTGFYPPDSGNAVDPTNSTLFYELISAEMVAPGVYTNRQFQIGVAGAQLLAATGVGTIFNARQVNASGDIEDRKLRAYSFLKDISPRQTNTIVVNNQPLIVFVAPVDGPNDRRINPIYYRVGNETNGAHNPATFDLWAEIKTKAGSRIIGNWKE